MRVAARSKKQSRPRRPASAADVAMIEWSAARVRRCSRNINHCTRHHAAKGRPAMSRNAGDVPTDGLSIAELIEQVDSRLEVLEPFVREAAQLEVARAALAAAAGSGARPRPERRARPSATARGTRAPRGANRDAIIKLARERPGVTVAEIAAVTRIGKPTVHSTVYALRSRGVLVTDGAGVRLAEAIAPSTSSDAPRVAPARGGTGVTRRRVAGRAARSRRASSRSRATASARAPARARATARARAPARARATARARAPARARAAAPGRRPASAPFKDPAPAAQPETPASTPETGAVSDAA
jgi:hypothetical protein